MTSREALEELERINSRQNNGKGDVWLEMIIDGIKRDLEVLEILKENNLLEYLIEKELFETANSYCGNTNKERERVKDYRNKLNKIKEWLENETH